MAYKRQEDTEESQPFLSNPANDSFLPAAVEMRVMGVQQQQPTYAHIPQGYYLPHAGDNLQQQQQQQQQSYAFAAPPAYYTYDQTQQQQQLPFHQPPSFSPAPSFPHAPAPHGYPQQYPVEEPFVPADPNLRTEFFLATAGFFLGFFIPIVWCSGWLFFRSHQRGTRAFARASLACICIGVVIAVLALLFLIFAMMHMTPIAQCVMVNGAAHANGCKACAATQGCGWCPSAGACLPLGMRYDGGDGRQRRQTPPPPVCNGSLLIATPDQCPLPPPSPPALSPSP